MREPQWMEWIRTTLQAPEREALLAALTSDQKAHLREHDYVWVPEVGVQWKPVDGSLRRIRFTHGAHFRTRRDELYIDSEGRARDFADPDEAQKVKTT